MPSQDVPLRPDIRSSATTLWRMAPATEATQCPDCRDLLVELCGQTVIEQSWFRLAPAARPCTTHRDAARARG
jgi:hypothetical protein